VHPRNGRGGRHLRQVPEAEGGSEGVRTHEVVGRGRWPRRRDAEPGEPARVRGAPGARRPGVGQRVVAVPAGTALHPWRLGRDGRVLPPAGVEAGHARRRARRRGHRRADGTVQVGVLGGAGAGGEVVQPWDEGAAIHAPIAATAAAAQREVRGAAGARAHLVRRARCTAHCWRRLATLKNRKFVTFVISNDSTRLLFYC
jgi:hypothetical protein